MVDNEEEMWGLLNRFNVSKISICYDTKGRLITKPVLISNFMFSFTHRRFVQHINRVMMIYPKIIERKKSVDLSERIEHYLYRSNILILLINSLEVYLDTVFRLASGFLFIRDLNKEIFIKFIKTFWITKNFFKKLIEKDNLEIELTEILPERMDFQNKDKCKVAFQLLNIDLLRLSEDIWHNIFDNEETSYMHTRHRVIHSDMSDIENLESECSVDFVERALLDIVKFIFFIEEKRLELYPSLFEVKFFEAMEIENSKPKDQRRPVGFIIIETEEKLKKLEE